MRFHAILFVRDEADVIAESLRHNSQWCDHIYVFDTGSTDETWEIVNVCSRSLPQVVPVNKQSISWHDGLRAMVFEQFRHQSNEGDWWVRLDADEFYHIFPPDFVQTLAPHETAIYHAYYNFRLTIEEANDLSVERFAMIERHKSIQERRRYYIPSFEYSEPRLFRYRKSIHWSPSAFGPYNAGYVARRRIPIRHYPDRDSFQMEHRYRLRRAMLKRMEQIGGPKYARSWDVADWRQKLASASDPQLRYWNPPVEDLPECTLNNHLASPVKRMVQRFVHHSLLPILDRTRPPYPVDFLPEPLDPIASMHVHQRETKDE